MKDPLTVDTDIIINPSTKKAVEKAQKKYLTVLHNKAEQDTEKKIRDLEHEGVAQATEIMK